MSTASNIVRDAKSMIIDGIEYVKASDKPSRAEDAANALPFRYRGVIDPIDPEVGITEKDIRFLENQNIDFVDKKAETSASGTIFGSAEDLLTAQELLNPSPELFKFGHISPDESQIFSEPQIQIIVGTKPARRYYWVHPEIALTLLAHDDFEDLRDNIYEQKAILIEKDLFQMSQLFKFLYTRHFHGEHAASAFFCTDKKDLPDLYNAVGYFKLEDLKPIVVRMMIHNRGIEQILADAVQVYSTGCADEQFNDALTTALRFAIRQRVDSGHRKWTSIFGKHQLECGLVRGGGLAKAMAKAVLYESIEMSFSCNDFVEMAQEKDQKFEENYEQNGSGVIGLGLNGIDLNMPTEAAQDEATKLSPEHFDHTFDSTPMLEVQTSE